MNSSAPISAANATAPSQASARLPKGDFLAAMQMMMVAHRLPSAPGPAVASSPTSDPKNRLQPLPEQTVEALAGSLQQPLSNGPMEPGLRTQLSVASADVTPRLQGGAENRISTPPQSSPAAPKESGMQSLKALAAKLKYAPEDSAPSPALPPASDFSAPPTLVPQPALVAMSVAIPQTPSQFSGSSIKSPRPASSTESLQAPGNRTLIAAAASVYNTGVPTTTADTSMKTSSLNPGAAGVGVHPETPSEVPGSGVAARRVQDGALTALPSRPDQGGSVASDDQRFVPVSVATSVAEATLRPEAGPSEMTSAGPQASVAPTSSLQATVATPPEPHSQSGASHSSGTVRSITSRAVLPRSSPAAPSGGSPPSAAEGTAVHLRPGSAQPIGAVAGQDGTRAIATSSEVTAKLSQSSEAAHVSVGSRIEPSAGHSGDVAPLISPSHVLERLDQALPVQPLQIRTDARHLAVGVQSGSLGWVEVHATTTAAGHVEALIQTQTDAGARQVLAQTNEVLAYAREHATTLSQLSVDVGQQHEPPARGSEEPPTPGRTTRDEGEVLTSFEGAGRDSTRPDSLISLHA